MILALDYDDTFTHDPEAWLQVANVLRQHGHTIYGVTMRYDTETAGMSHKYLAACDRIYFTGRQAKRQFMADRGVIISVWIDDTPDWILMGAGK